MRHRHRRYSLSTVNVVTYSGEREMKSRKGFTLIELMVVVLIVAVLAAVLIPMLTARLEAARWSEGKAGAGTIATAIRAMVAEQGEDFAAIDDAATYLNQADLRGKYFSIGDYTVNVTYPSTVADYPVEYLITVGQPTNPTVTVTWNEAGYSLDHTGDWTRLTP
jgi:prepilin-type N-terminal cleavage/methylation domain-containing protein